MLMRTLGHMKSNLTVVESTESAAAE